MSPKKNCLGFSRTTRNPKHKERGNFSSRQSNRRSPKSPLTFFWKKEKKTNAIKQQCPPNRNPTASTSETSRGRPRSKSCRVCSPTRRTSRSQPYVFFSYFVFLSPRSFFFPTFFFLPFPETARADSFFFFFLLSSSLSRANIREKRRRRRRKRRRLSRLSLSLSLSLFFSRTKRREERNARAGGLR